MNPFPKDKNFTRVQVLDDSDLTIPQSAALMVRGGSVFQKGLVVGDTDTVIPGALRFRGNHLQIRELQGWVDIHGVLGQGQPNELITFADDGDSLQTTGVDLLNRQMTNLDLLEVQTINPPAASSLELGLSMGGQSISLPPNWGAAGQVLSTNADGSLTWINNVPANELSFQGAAWPDNVLLRTVAGTSGHMETTGLVVDPINAATTCISTPSMNLKLDSPGGVQLTNNVMPTTVAGTAYQTLAVGPLGGGMLRTYDLFANPTVWAADGIMTSTGTNAQIQRNTAATIDAVGNMTTTGNVSAVGVNATSVSATGAITGGSVGDGTAVMTGGNLTTTGTVSATTVTDGTVTMMGGTITGLASLNVAGALNAGTIASTVGNITSAGSVLATGAVSAATASVTGAASLGGNAYPTIPGTNGYVLTTNGAGTLFWTPKGGGGSGDLYIPVFPATVGTLLTTTGTLDEMQDSGYTISGANLARAGTVTLESTGFAAANGSVNINTGNGNAGNVW
jgi:hypothetical protein